VDNVPPLQQHFDGVFARFTRYPCGRCEHGDVNLRHIFFAYCVPIHLSVTPAQVDRLTFEGCVQGAYNWLLSNWVLDHLAFSPSFGVYHSKLKATRRWLRSQRIGSRRNLSIVYASPSMPTHFHKGSLHDTSPSQEHLIGSSPMPIIVWPCGTTEQAFIPQPGLRNRLCHHGACSCALVLPVRLQDTDCLVVSAQTVDSGFNENESEFGVLVFSVALEMLSDGNGLLDQHVKVLWDFGCETAGFQDSQDLVTGNNLDLGDTMAVSKDNSDL